MFSEHILHINTDKLSIILMLNHTVFVTTNALTVNINPDRQSDNNDRLFISVIS